MLNIEQPFTGKYALSHLGFRPFFLAATAFAVIVMVLWAGIYGFGWDSLPVGYPAISWHAHEMIFGYTAAVIAGFLLTAIKNWTNQQTLHELPLLVLVGMWAAARILPFTGLPLAVTAVMDSLFSLWLALVVARPILRVKQWQHAALAGKVALLAVANIVYYWGLLSQSAVILQVGLYSGFYLILGIIFTMGRRVIPFFIERGVGCPFEAKNDVWLDRASMILFVAFAIADVVFIATGNELATLLTAMLALIQVLVHSTRLVGWYHPNLWEKSLLWVLYLGYIWLIGGFLMKFLTIALHVSPWIAVHAFAYGGIGMITIGMMARVALGHTGRNVFEPPVILVAVFLLLFSGAFIRVLNVWIVPEFYDIWILTTQFLWISAFAIFLWYYAPMLIKPRVDGRYG